MVWQPVLGKNRHGCQCNHDGEKSHDAEPRDAGPNGCLGIGCVSGPDRGIRIWRTCFGDFSTPVRSRVVAGGKRIGRRGHSAQQRMENAGDSVCLAGISDEDDGPGAVHMRRIPGFHRSRQADGQVACAGDECRFLADGSPTLLLVSALRSLVLRVLTKPSDVSSLFSCGGVRCSRMCHDHAHGIVRRLYRVSEFTEERST